MLIRVISDAASISEYWVRFPGGPAKSMAIYFPYPP